MCPIDDGVIKYDRSQYIKSDALKVDEYKALENWRKTLHQLKLIGEYLPERIGYGNLSQKRDYSDIHSPGPKSQFVITGTQTGGLVDLNGDSYTRVLDYNFESWSAKTMGPLEASSEALTHAAIYEADPEITAVFHIHNNDIWKGMIENNYPATSEKIPYGTKEMATAVKELIINDHLGLIVMKGHEDGVIAYGKTLEEAGKKILEVYDKFGR